METEIGIASAAVKLPTAKRDISSIFQEEAAPYNQAIADRLGIEEVPIAEGESGSALALTACQDALGRADLDVTQLDVIVDYSILPQEYLVPAWNMSNKLQHELGAKKAFTVGFSGGGATNFLVALSSAVALLQANENLKSALLVAADITIPGNRILNPADPVSLLGDSAGAMVLKKEAARSLVIDTEFHSEGSNHNVYHIPGGALAHPDDPALYRIELDKKRYNEAAKTKKLKVMFNTLLERAGVKRGDVAFALYPNLSSEDQRRFSDALEFPLNQIDTTNRKSHGHLQGTDFVVNYLSMIESQSVEKGQYFLMASHGMGFLAGITLLRL